MERAYGYLYDGANRLVQGDYVARHAGTQAWTAEAQRFGLSGMRYDANGNVLSLQRRGLLAAGRSRAPQRFGAVDDLTYAYAGNQLQAVNDAVGTNELPRAAGYNGAPTSLAGDFQEQGVRQGQEYTYDLNGNTTQDRNKGLTGIAYNHLNLPRQIHFGTGADSLVFRYTAAGQKVAKLVYQTGQPVRRTDYLGPYQYEQDSLRFFPHAEGRVLRFVSPLSAQVSYQREFTLKDHLGNLRLAYRLGQVRTYAATLEQDDATRRRETQQFDSLSVSPPVAQHVGSQARTGQYAAKLNAGGAAPQPLGPLLRVAVQRGDTLTLTAPGLYPQPVQHGFLFSLGAFLAEVLHPAAPAPAGPEALRGKQGLPLLQVGVAAGLTQLPQLRGGVPKGYARVLCFNRDSVLVSEQVRQLSAAALNSYEPLRLQVVVPEDGYVTAYVGNESDTDVLFDDVSIEHRPGLQVQETHYDPTGLELAGLAPPSPGLRGLNQYRWNGKEFQADLGLNWTQLDWRFFDAQTDHLPGVDPEIENGQESMSPYAFGFDNAVRYNDPSGRCPDGNCPPDVLPAPGFLDRAMHAIGQELHNNWQVKDLVNDLQMNPETGPLLKAYGALANLLTIATAIENAPDLPQPATLPTHGTAAPPSAQASAASGRVNATAGSRKGQVFTPKEKAIVVDKNAQKNAGNVVCEGCGVQTTTPTKSQKGVTPPKTDRQIDHIEPKSKGGSGTAENGQVLCRGCNRQKGNN